MNALKQQLPRNIRRPLWGATLALGGSLLVFCLWATLAPLATTITLHGHVVSSTPAFALQHPYGGSVKTVLVAPHERVETGQVLMRLETGVLQETLATQVSIRDRILRENRDIDVIMASLDTPIIRVGLAASAHILRHEHVLRKAAASQETADNLRRQVQALKDKIGHSKEQLLLMTARQKRQSSLAAKGLLARDENELLHEQILIVRGEIESDRASVLSLESQITQTLQQRDLSRIAWEHELVATHQQNLSKLDDLKRSILGLRDQIEKATVKAPIDGVVTSIPVQSEGMFAARGGTLLTLAQPLDNAQVTFTIPVDYIDQIRPGLLARVTIPSLPQRLMPKIDLAIEAISPRADTDENGNPTGYQGLALADEAALKSLEAIKGIGPLSEDMPVILTVSVRETTLAQYLVAPLLASFSKAFQD